MAGPMESGVVALCFGLALCANPRTKQNPQTGRISFGPGLFSTRQQQQQQQQLEYGS
jgi:hypothetical protein